VLVPIGTARRADKTNLAHPWFIERRLDDVAPIFWGAPFVEAIKDDDRNGVFTIGLPMFEPPVQLALPVCIREQAVYVLYD
jgi:hypothetical protein